MDVVVDVLTTNGGSSALAMGVGIYATFVLNFCDFTRGAKSKRSVVLGNLWGIPVNMLFFGLVVVVLTGGRLSVDGRVITSPTDVVESRVRADGSSVLSEIHTNATKASIAI